MTSHNFNTSQEMVTFPSNHMLGSSVWDSDIIEDRVPSLRVQRIFRAIVPILFRCRLQGQVGRRLRPRR